MSGELPPEVETTRLKMVFGVGLKSDSRTVGPRRFNSLLWDVGWSTVGAEPFGADHLHFQSRGG